MCPVVLNLSLYLYSSKYTQLYSSWFNPCCNHTAVYQHSSLALAVPKYKCCVCPPLINLQKEHTLTWKLKKKSDWLTDWQGAGVLLPDWTIDSGRRFALGFWLAHGDRVLLRSECLSSEMRAMSALHSVAITFLLSAPLCLSHMHTQASMHPYSTSQFISWNQKARCSNSSKATGSHISTLGSCMGFPSSSVWENIFSVTFF